MREFILEIAAALPDIADCVSWRGSETGKKMILSGAQPSCPPGAPEAARIRRARDSRPAGTSLPGRIPAPRRPIRTAGSSCLSVSFLLSDPGAVRMQPPKRGPGHRAGATVPPPPLSGITKLPPAHGRQKGFGDLCPPVWHCAVCSAVPCRCGKRECRMLPGQAGACRCLTTQKAG